MRPFWLYSAAKKFPKEIAIYADLKKIHYIEYYSISIHLKEWILSKYPFKERDRIGICMQNSMEYALLIMAFHISDLVAVHLSPRYTPKILQTLLHKNKIKYVISDRHHEMDGVKLILIEDIFKKFTIHFNHINDHLFHGNVEKIPKNFLDFSQISNIIFTSSSSGTPKGVIHDHGNHYYSALGSNLNIPLKPGDAWLASLPFYHVGGLSILYRTIISGASVVISRSNLEDSLKNEKISHISLVPTQLIRLMENIQMTNRLKKLRAILLGGDLITKSLLKKAKEIGLNLFCSYGSSEMSSQITTTPYGEEKKYLPNAGKILPFREIKIADDQEIYLRNRVLFKEYSKETAKIDEEGWFHSGDIGKIDKNGYLQLMGRKDNMFMSGGENIYPEEIESKIYMINEIRFAIIIPFPDTEFGQRPVAFINIRKGDFNKIIRKINVLLQKELPKFKIPVAYYPLSQKDIDLKINRKKLIQEKYSLRTSLKNVMH